MRFNIEELPEYGILPSDHPVACQVRVIMDGVCVRVHPKIPNHHWIDWGGKADEAHRLYLRFNTESKADYSWIAYVWLVSVLSRSSAS